MKAFVFIGRLYFLLESFVFSIGNGEFIWEGQMGRGIVLSLCLCIYYIDAFYVVAIWPSIHIPYVLDQLDLFFK